MTVHAFRALPAAALLVLLAACSGAPAATAPGPAANASTAPPSGQEAVRASLNALPVRPFVEVDGYSRAAFGQRWKDVDRNGCDTRNDVLRRDLADVVADPRTRGCVVLSGLLTDPYTGRSRAFLRGERTSPQVAVDHVVALAAAWRTGAAGWTPARREEFANDPLNLLAVTREANEDKSGADAARWLPPLDSARCPFVTRQVAVKRRWALSVTPAERAAILAVLRSCPRVSAGAGRSPPAARAGSSRSPTG